MSKLDGTPVPALSQTFSVRMYDVLEDAAFELTKVTGAKSERHMPIRIIIEVILTLLKYSNSAFPVNMKL